MAALYSTHYQEDGKRLAQVIDEDLFVMSGAEDLVPKFKIGASEPEVIQRGEDQNANMVHRYRPRTEGLFARIERWVKIDGTHKGDIHWRATTKNNVTSIYGRTDSARISDLDNPDHIFEWLLQETYDAKGNHILYEYAGEDPDLRIKTIYEQNRSYSSQRYIRRIYYGNAPAQMEDRDLIGPRRIGIDHTDHLNLISRRYLFEVLFDYGDLGNDDLLTYVMAVPPAGDRSYLMFKYNIAASKKRGHEIGEWLAGKSIVWFNDPEVADDGLDRWMIDALFWTSEYPNIKPEHFNLG